MTLINHPRALGLLNIEYAVAHKVPFRRRLRGLSFQQFAQIEGFAVRELKRDDGRNAAPVKSNIHALGTPYSPASIM